MTYREHLQSIALEHQIFVTEAESLPQHAGTVCVPLRMMLLPAIKDETSYAVGLHEFGHILHPYGHDLSLGTHGDPNDPNHLRNCLAEEYAAWSWAEEACVKAGFEWTIAVEHTRMIALASYQNRLTFLLEAA